MVVNIGFTAVNINAQRRDSSLSIGESNQAGWGAHSKHNAGYGIAIGLNSQVNIINNISDFDGVDSPINDSDFVPSEQNQSV